MGPSKLYQLKPKMPAQHYMNETDHDLLVALNVKMDQVKSDVQTLQVKTDAKADIARLIAIEQDVKARATAEDVTKVEKSVNAVCLDVEDLKKKMWMATGALAAIEVGLRFIKF